MQEIYDIIKEAGVYYIATVEDDQPRVRAFSTFLLFEGKFYIQTGKVKEVSKQIHINPKMELCAFTKGKMIRIEGTLVEDERIEAKQAMLDAYPGLKNRYAVDDGNTEVFYITNMKATLSIGGKVTVLSGN